jgi:hypothetical protein
VSFFPFFPLFSVVSIFSLFLSFPISPLHFISIYYINFLFPSFFLFCISLRSNRTVSLPLDSSLLLLLLLLLLLYIPYLLVPNFIILPSHILSSLTQFHCYTSFRLSTKCL